ncbi:MAG: hypothetical protein K0S56_1203 [Microvirga sp.]|jgi:urease accessory protein|nr:hypothetical protein [Microvirga sp.]
MTSLRRSDDEHDGRQDDTWLSVGRESRELQLEDRRMDEALLRLLADLDVMRADAARMRGARPFGFTDPSPSAAAGGTQARSG